MKFYTVKQVAQALDFSTNTVYKYLDEGKIKATRLATEGRFRIPEAEVIRLLQLKGDNPQIAPALNSEHSENSASQNVSVSDSQINRISDSSDAPSNSEFSGSTNQESALAILNKISNPDLFDWFLSLSAIFLGVAFFFFPVHYESLSFEPYLGLLFWSKMILIVSGIVLMADDIFTPLKAHHHHILARTPLIVGLSALSVIFYLTGEYWIASYFATFAVFGILSIFWHARAFIKFISLVYVLMVSSGLVYARSPEAFIFADIGDFIKFYPGVFEILLVGFSTTIFIILLASYIRKYSYSYLFSILLSGLFFLFSVSFIFDQAWNRAVINLMIGSFLLIFLFEQRFDSISKFTRKQVLIAFCWMIVVTLIGFSLVWYTQESSRETALMEASKRLDQAVIVVDAFLADGVKYTETIAQNPEIIKLLSSKKLEIDSLDPLVKNLYLGSTTLKRVIIAESSGKVLSYYPLSDSQTAIDLSDRAYFKESISAKKTIVSDSVASKFDSSDRIVAIARPILGQDGEILAVAVGHIDLKALAGKLSNIDFDRGGFFELADSSKTIFIHENPGLIGKKAEVNSALITAVEGRSGQVEGYSEEGELSLQSFAPIKSLGWGMVARQNFSTAFAKSSKVSFAIFMVTIISGVGSLVAAIYISRGARNSSSALDEVASSAYISRGARNSSSAYLNRKEVR